MSAIPQPKFQGSSSSSNGPFVNQPVIAIGQPNGNGNIGGLLQALGYAPASGGTPFGRVSPDLNTLSTYHDVGTSPVVSSSVSVGDSSIGFNIGLYGLLIGGGLLAFLLLRK